MVSPRKRNAQKCLRTHQMVVLGMSVILFLTMIGCKPKNQSINANARALTEISASPNMEIINELLSDDANVRDMANVRVKEAIRADMDKHMEVIGAHISWKMGELFPDVKHEKTRPHSGTIREFVIRSAASCGWWPQDINPNTVRCTIYKRQGFGPTLFECVIDVVCHDEDTISFEFVGHEYHTDFEWIHCSALYGCLTGKTKTRSRPFADDRLRPKDFSK